MAAAHDVGKVSPGYQLKHFREILRAKQLNIADHALERYDSRHALIGEATIDAHWEKGESAAGVAVGAHHGTREKPSVRHDAGVYGGPAWAEQRLEFLRCLIDEYGPLSGGGPIDPWVLAGFVCAADWMGSDERFFPPAGLPLGTGRSERARTAVAECGWQPMPLKPGLSFEQIFGFAPNDIQREFIEAVERPGLYVLEAPMGTGKTEAALYAAYLLNTSGANAGLYFGLPTRLTSDKIHERVCTFLGSVAGPEASVRLAHGDAWQRAFQPGGGAMAPGKEWFSPSKRALLMPFGVGTIDQALFAVIKVRHFFMRCFGLAGKVVVLDEVHSYDVYTGTLLDILVRRLLETKCTVIVLSATLTRARRAKLFGVPRAVELEGRYPLVTSETAAGTSQRPLSAPEETRVDIRFAALDNAAVAEQAVSRASAGHCVVCIANTVARAQSWYNHVKAAMPEGAFPVGILHSKFPGWRRQELESTWMQALGTSGPRPAGCILVATQVIEQSVDIDADFMISELAPTDMLLQRLGRLWRHPPRARPSKEPTILVVAPVLERVRSLDEFEQALGKPNCRVYAPYVLWRSYHAWKGLASLLLPSGIPPLLEATYAEPVEPPPAFVDEARRSLDRRAERLRALANAARADLVGFPTLSDGETAATRYSDRPMLDAVVARSVTASGGGAELVLSNGRTVQVDRYRWAPPFAIALHQNRVPVPAYRLVAARTPAYLERYFYGRTPVLVVTDNAALTLDGVPTGMRYDNERGLQMDPVVSRAASQRTSEGLVDVDYDDDAGEPDELVW